MTVAMFYTYSQEENAFYDVEASETAKKEKIEKLIYACVLYVYYNGCIQNHYNKSTVKWNRHVKVTVL